MVKKNGFPESVQAGIPNPYPTPLGWNKTHLGKYLHEVKRRANLQPKHQYRLVTVRRARGGVVEREVLHGEDIKTPTQFYVKGGDFLISKRQIVHGACGLVPDDLDGAIVSNEYAVLGSDGMLDLEFLRYLSETIYFQQTCFHSSVGVHIEKMIFSVDRWLKWDFNFPPLPEQKKIARILSTWDRAIETVERLIANSKAQKKALMQQLLTGKRRFPGFEVEWREVRLSDVATVIVSNVDKKSIPGETPVRLCNYTDVYYNRHITRHMDFMQATALPREVAKFSLREGDVIITKDSETPDDIAVPALVTEDLEGVVCGYHLAIIRPKPKKAQGAFLGNLFELDRIRYYFFTLANGATRFGLGVDAIGNAQFLVPHSVEEQNHIARAIAGTEHVIQSQGKQLENLRQQKKALMQQLLTGKRRVKVDEEAA